MGRQGAIKRMKLEEDGAKITYESFVEDLDEGDSFTTSLVDVLVKVRLCDAWSRQSVLIFWRTGVSRT